MNASQQPEQPNQNAIGGAVRRQFAPFTQQAMQNAAPNSMPGQYAAQASQPMAQATNPAPPAQTVNPSYTPTQGQRMPGVGGVMQDVTSRLMSPFMDVFSGRKPPTELYNLIRAQAEKPFDYGSYFKR